MRSILTAGAVFAAATPAFAAGGDGFFTFHNTNFTVTLGFIVFVAILLWFGVPGKVTGLLDKRATTIRAELDEAKALREEAQKILASFERKQKEVQDQAARIVANARDEAEAAAKQARIDLERSVARRLQAAEDQIAAAESGAIRQVRNTAAEIAVAAAGEVIAGQMTKSEGEKLIDRSLGEIETRLH